MSFVGTRKASVEPDEGYNSDENLKDGEDDEIIYLDENNQYGKGKHYDDDFFSIVLKMI